MSAATFAALLQSFFSDRLLRQMRASPNTVAGYRDAFRLLLRYASDRLGKEPSCLAIDDPAPALGTAFLASPRAEPATTARPGTTEKVALEADAGLAFSSGSTRKFHSAAIFPRRATRIL